MRAAADTFHSAGNDNNNNNEHSDHKEKLAERQQEIEAIDGQKAQQSARRAIHAAEPSGHGLVAAFAVKQREKLLVVLLPEITVGEQVRTPAPIGLAVGLRLARRGGSGLGEPEHGHAGGGLLPSHEERGRKVKIKTGDF